MDQLQTVGLSQLTRKADILVCLKKTEDLCKGMTLGPRLGNA